MSAKYHRILRLLCHKNYHWLQDTKEIFDIHMIQIQTPYVRPFFLSTHLTMSAWRGVFPSESGELITSLAPCSRSSCTATRVSAAERLPIKISTCSA